MFARPIANNQAKDVPSLNNPPDNSSADNSSPDNAPPDNAPPDNSPFDNSSPSDDILLAMREPSEFENEWKRPLT